MIDRDEMRESLLARFDAAPPTRNPWVRIADHALICFTILGLAWILAEHSLLPEITGEAELFGFLGIDEGAIGAMAAFLFGERAVRRWRNHK